jgi:hypothetical protein
VEEAAAEEVVYFSPRPRPVSHRVRPSRSEREVLEERVVVLRPGLMVQSEAKPSSTTGPGRDGPLLAAAAVAKAMQELLAVVVEEEGEEVHPLGLPRGHCLGEMEVVHYRVTSPKLPVYGTARAALVGRAALAATPPTSMERMAVTPNTEEAEAAALERAMRGRQRMAVVPGRAEAAEGPAISREVPAPVAMVARGEVSLPVAEVRGSPVERERLAPQIHSGWAMAEGAEERQRSEGLEDFREAAERVEGIPTAGRAVLVD